MGKDQNKGYNGILKKPDFYHTLLDSITDGVFVLNQNWEYLLVNQKAADLVKMTSDQLLNKKITDLFPGIEQTQFFRKYEQVMKERKIERIFDEFIHPDGRKGYYEVSVYPIPEGILCISRDITDSKTIEEELLKEKLITETALNAQQDTFFILEISTGKAIRWNNAFRDISGYSDQEISKMKAPDSYYSIEDLKKAEETIEITLNKTISNTEISLITKSGKKIPFEYYTSIIKDSEGNPKYVVSIGRDITERKQVEDKLRENEHYLKEAQEMSHIGYFKLNPTTLEVSGSDELFKIFGLSHDEASLDAFAEVVHPDDKEYDLYHIRRGMELGESWDIEHRLILKDGTEKWVHAIGEAMKDETGKVILLLGTIQDITEWKKVEEVLHHERDLIRTLLENHPDFIYFKDREGRFQHISKRFCEFFGRTMEDIIGKTDLELFPEEVATRSYNEDLHVIKTETPLINKEENAAGIWVLTTKIPWFDKDGNTKGLFGISHDITERKKAEQKLRESEENYKKLSLELELILDNIPAIIFYKDLENNYIQVNKYLADSMKVSKEFLQDKNMLELFPKEDSQAYWADDLEVAKSGQPKFNIVEPYETGEGIRWVNTSKIPIFDRNKNVIGIIGMAVDVTERKIAEENLKKSEENYRNAFERVELYKDLFAHDISNMLQNIRTSVGLFSFLRNSPEQLEKLDDIMEIINDQIIRGSKLVSNIRKLSQVSESENILEKVNLNREIKEAIKFIRESFPNKNLDIKIESDFKDLVVKANALLLDLLENILFNAVKYTEKPTIEILIRISKELKNEIKYLKIEFIDNGIGISDTMKEKIFEGITTHKKRTKGMGLGLLLVKRILDRYNGEIWVEDNNRGDPSQGSNFIILIPEEVD